MNETSPSLIQFQVEEQLADPKYLLESDFGAAAIPVFCLYTFSADAFFPRYSYIVFQMGEGVYFCKFHWGSRDLSTRNTIKNYTSPKYIKFTGSVPSKLMEWLTFLESIEMPSAQVEALKDCGNAISCDRHGVTTYYRDQNIQCNWLAPDDSHDSERSSMATEMFSTWHSDTVAYLDSLIR